MRPPAARTILWAAAGLCLSSPPAPAATCSLEQADAAEATVDHLDSWPKVYSFFRTYRACDDGAISEGVSDAVTRLLADHWDNSPALVALAHKNGKFKEFVLSHIDSTADTGAVERLRSNAMTRCGPTMSGVCKDITLAANRAMK